MQKIIKYILFISVSSVLMYFAFKDQNLAEIVSKLKNIEYSWLLFSMGFGAIAIISRGVRWVYLIKALGYNSSIKNSVNSVAVGYLTNILIPRAGEISRCTSLQQVEKIPFNKLFGTIILERVIDFAILTALILVSFLYKYQEINSFFGEILGSSNESLLTNPIIVFLIIFSLILYLLKNQIKKLKYYEKIKSLASGVKEGFISLKNLDHKTPFIMHTILIWLMYLLMTYVCFFAIAETENLNIFDGVYILVIGGLGMVVPSQGGIGSYHLAVKIGLVGIGISAQPALLFAFAVHTAQTLMTIIFGIISSLLLLSHNKSKNE